MWKWHIRDKYIGQNKFIHSIYTYTYGYIFSKLIPKLRQALNIYGVQLASSLSKIILKGHEEFKNKIFFLLNEKKKIKNNSTCEKEEYNNKFTSYDENILTRELYSHIKEKIMLNEKTYENPKAKIQLTGDSNKSYYKNDPSKDDSYSDDDGDYK